MKSLNEMEELKRFQGSTFDEFLRRRLIENQDTILESRSVGMLSRNDKPPDIWDTHGISGNVFVNPPASSSTPYPPGQGFNPWISNVSEQTSPPVMSERQTPDPALDPRCQSGPSARNSVIPGEGRLFT